MYRRGRRAEALVIGAVGLLFLVYNSGYYLPYGGRVPGPRFLITALPFLAVPLALAFRRHRGPALALAAASVVCMAIPTLVKPFVSAESDTGQWMRLFEKHDFQAQVAKVFGAWSWDSIVPFLVFVIVAVIFAARATPRLGLTWRQVAAGVATVALWAPLAIFAPRVLGIDHAAEREIVRAGDPTAVHERFGNHPISHLALLALAVALLVTLLAGLASWVSTRRRGAGPEATEPPPQRIGAAPASVA
jgi:hypothetical protein